MAYVIIDEKNYETEVEKSTKPVILDFYADWCGPCRMLSPIIEEVAEAYPQIKVGKVNVDEARELAVKFGIDSIPTVIFFKNGKPVNSFIGYREKSQILPMAEAIL